MMQPQMMQPVGFDPNAAYWQGMALAQQQSAWIQPPAPVSPQVPWGQPDPYGWAQAQEVSPYGASYPSLGMDAAGEFMQMLGIDPSEDVYFGWIAEYGLQSEALPPRWASGVDAQTGRIYYVNTDDGTSTWENPLCNALRTVIDIGRFYLQAPGDGVFEEQKMQLWQQHKQDLEGWHGPHVDEEGREYFANSELGVSSWQDPRQETQHIFEVQSNLLDALEEMLPGYVDTQGELPGFGLLDRRPRSMLEVRGNSFSMDSQPTSPGRSPTPQRSVSSPDLSKKHQQLTAKMEKPEPTFQELRGSLLQTLETFFYIYRDDEESQHLLIQRKLKERRLRRQRLDEEERRKLNQELEEMKRQEEERRQEEEARREAQAAAERAKREAEEQRKREEERKAEEERQRIHAEEQRRRADAERRAEEARREEARAAEEARLRKVAEEDARNREKEIRERILGSLAELAQSRDGYVLRTAIAEGESVGLKEELAPLRSALAEVDELRKAALLKARKAQEKLAGDFKTAKEAQDFGGPILAAQWRAAVKEVAKPFVMPDRKSVV